MWHKAGRNQDLTGAYLNPVPLSVEAELVIKQMMVNAADIKACTSTSLHIFQAHQGMPGASASPGQLRIERWQREQIPELQLLPSC